MFSVPMIQPDSEWQENVQNGRLEQEARLATSLQAAESTPLTTHFELNTCFTTYSQNLESSWGHPSKCKRKLIASQNGQVSIFSKN